MRPFVLLAALTLAALPVLAQPRTADRTPEAAFRTEDLTAHLRFLASDELMGRRPGTPGAAAAARYIAEQFRRVGARPAPGTDDYYQIVPLGTVTPPRRASLLLGPDTLRLGTDLLVFAGNALDFDGEAVYVGYGAAAADYAGRDVRGKVALARVGTGPGGSPQAALGAATRKRALADSLGAVALVELYDAALPWANVARNLSRARTDASGTGAGRLVHAWVQDAGGARIARYAESPTARLRFTTDAATVVSMASPNVAAFIEGTDPRLKHEVVALTAHYDHVGAGLTRGAGATAQDSIFNGARDNGTGTVALIAAAQALAVQPPKRSVLIVAYTAEEMGLLGSRYFAEHPLVPLDRIVYNLNVDTGGISDTTVVTFIGHGRTSADPIFAQALAPFSLTPLPDPSPEQGLFDRSDNVALAARGIPAPTFSPGFRAFTDPGVASFYHRVTDEADETYPFTYLRKFAQAYTRTARLIADAPQRPRWTPGDR
ncbi:MAG TPA: M28 family peptidase, partial [Rhodothermales bacterium]|nr:M28 family peptidase [Rhodothermales bacterium]